MHTNLISSGRTICLNTHCAYTQHTQPLLLIHIYICLHFEQKIQICNNNKKQEHQGYAIYSHYHMLHEMRKFEMIIHCSCMYTLKIFKLNAIIYLFGCSCMLKDVCYAIRFCCQYQYNYCCCCCCCCYIADFSFHFMTTSCVCQFAQSFFFHYLLTKTKKKENTKFKAE